jgi:NADPH-dependent 2,4-dienoyl-CoA reductase/sulfur reductase-like enzyme
MGATTEIVVINPTDYFLYLPLMPLMPQVAGGMVEPAHSRVSLPSRLRSETRFVLGTVTRVDPSPAAKTVSWAGPEGAAGQVRYDRLTLAAGSVDKLLPIPGLADYAHGFRSSSEATSVSVSRRMTSAKVGALITSDAYFPIPSTEKCSPSAMQLNACFQNGTEPVNRDHPNRVIQPRPTADNAV